MAPNRLLDMLLASSRLRGLSSQRGACRRSFSAGSNYSAEVDEINSKFAEAREEIESAMESKETLYFDEDAQSARDAVKLVLDKYDTLLKSLPDSERSSVQRSMGLKMEQLKAELEQLHS